ncbi:putative muscle M-line assembly protein unc-89 [Apostichopus japonicus]|uniref:Putative muscle M-line assembly protein unc-89 n=1 Tax=Stichopus japonicus TaxID=307972 RepID=A0A2G8LL24_STIJA|nr:putative muscle M-line assembly protein unc-89 [Apostichopus japonicus]
MYHNGDEVGLVIPQSHKDDEGIYACRAATAAGEDMTNSKVIVTEHIKPQFTRRLQSQFAAVDGEPLELSCSVTGDPTPTIQWYKDGKLLDGQSDFEITFSRGEVKLKSSKTTVTDEGVFSCRAVNPAGDDITSCNLLVEAPEPPHIKPYFSSTLEPDLNLPLGEPLILACTVHGYPKPSVTWFKDGVGLENEAPYEITFMHGEATLQVPETIDEDVGVYSCVATNSSGEVSSTCFVSLAAPEPPPSRPHFTTRLEPDLSIPSDETLTLKCKVGGYPPPKTTWYKDGTPLRNEPPYEITTRNGEAVLKVPQAEEEDGGVYSCLATNPSGQDSTSSNVTVAAPEPPPSKPHFISRLEPEMTIPNGDPLHLKCKVGGYPLPKTTWYIDGNPLKNIPPYEIASRGGESSLRIPQTEENDGGVYSCLATNPSGQDTTSSNVTVEAPEPPPSKPHFTLDWSQTQFPDGEPLVLKCKVGGYPPPKTTWYKDGTPLKNEVPYEITSRGGEASLRIPEAMEDDGGLEPEPSLPDGGPLVLKCKVGGYPPPKTTWYKDGTPSKNEPPFEITSRGGEASLRIPEAMEDDGGVYSCLATNPSGQDSTSSNVTVAGGYPPPKTTWYKDGTPLKNEVPYEITSRGGEASLRIPEAMEDDGGVYSCLATNPSGQDSTSSNVTVAAPEPPPSKPHFTSRLEPELSLNDGEPLVLKCKVGGYPPPKTTWYKDGTPSRMSHHLKLQAEVVKLVLGYQRQWKMMVGCIHV